MGVEEITVHQIPIPIRALGYASVYEVGLTNGSLLIDSGMNQSSGEEILRMLKYPKEIELLALTHIHIDHIGGALAIQKKLSCDVAMGEPDLNLMRMIASDPEGYASEYARIAVSFGFPSDQTESIKAGLPFLSGTNQYDELQVRKNLRGKGDLIDGIKFELMPGHSPGSTIYLDPQSKDLFCGDHILSRITPNISFYDTETDMLGMYLESLEKTRLIQAKTCYPGHGTPFDGVSDRIQQIKQHHTDRMSEIASLLPGWKTAYQTAKEMKWNRGRQIASMNEMERNFAFAEALSHLIHMTRTGSVIQKEQDGVVVFKSST